MVAPGGLDVQHDVFRAGLRELDEVEDRLGGGLEVRQQLGLADRLPKLLLELDQRPKLTVGEEDGLCHDVFGQNFRAGLDHHDRVPCAGDDEVELRLGKLAVRGVDHELAADAADAHRRDWALERNLADRQRCRRGEGAQDVGVVLLVRGKDRDHELDVVLVAVREERPNWAVRQAGGKDGRLRGARLALDEATRDLARGIHPLLKIDGEREEVQAGPGI